uniref:Uncharacterized protein n=1 Tax=Sphaerodactylus townsendi TaxID=933632 RepID=A0ACB8EL53_9SAUR
MGRVQARDGHKVIMKATDLVKRASVKATHTMVATRISSEPSEKVLVGLGTELPEPGDSIPGSCKWRTGSSKSSPSNRVLWILGAVIEDTTLTRDLPPRLSNLRCQTE